MNIDINYWSKVIKNILLLLLTLISIFLLFKLSFFYIPFLIGFIISLLIEPVIKFLSSITGFTRKTNAIIVLLIVFTILSGLLIFGIVTLISESSSLLETINIYIEKIYSKIQEYISNIRNGKIQISGQIISILESSTTNILNYISNSITNILTTVLQGIAYIPKFSIYAVITILSTYFICSDRFYILDQFEHHFPKKWVRKFGNNIRKIINSLGCYLKAEVTLVLITFIEILTGLLILKLIGLNINYPFLIALGIGFVDALPILRSSEQ